VDAYEVELRGARRHGCRRGASPGVRPRRALSPARTGSLPRPRPLRRRRLLRVASTPQPLTMSGWDTFLFTSFKKFPILTRYSLTTERRVQEMKQSVPTSETERARQNLLNRLAGLTEEGDMSGVAHIKAELAKLPAQSADTK